MMYKAALWQGPRTAIEPADRDRFDRATEVAETIEERQARILQAETASADAAASADADAMATEAGRQQAVAAAAQTGLDRAQAETARAQAEAAAVAAALNGGIKATIAEGRAAVADGESFAVQAGGSDGLARTTIFRRLTDSTQEPLLQLVASVEVDAEVAERRAMIRNSGADALKVKDAAGFVVGRMDETGLSIMGQKVAIPPVGGKATIPAPDGTPAAQVEPGVLDLLDGGDFRIRDQHGFVVFRAGADRLEHMGVPIGSGGGTDPSEIREIALDTARDVTGIDKRPPRPFRKWVRARAGVVSGLSRARLLAIGDSNTVGWAALGTGSNRRAHAYPTALARLLPEYRPTQANVFGRQITSSAAADYEIYDPRLVIGNGWGSSGSSAGGGMWANSTTTEALVFTPSEVWDTAEVYVALDAAASIDIGISGTMASHNPTTGSIVKLTYSAPTAAVQALEIARASGSARIVGWHCYDSRTAGLDIINVGRSGWRSDQAADATSYYSPLNAAAALAADLWIVQLGLNDFNQDIAVSTFTASMDAILSRAQGLGVPVVLVVSMTPGATSTPPWSEYRAAVYGLAETYGCAVVDIGIRFGAYATAVSDGLVSDSLHPNAYGYAETAQAIRNLLIM